MKNPIIVFAITAATLVMSSCAGNAEKQNTEKDNSEATKTEKTTESCTFNYEEGSATVNWIAFKTTDKIAVGGEFDKVTASADQGDNFSSMLESISFEINTGSTNTKDTARDAKIVAAFFGAMANADVISGEAKSVNGDDEAGEMVFALNMNEVTKDVSLEYKVESGIITLEGSIDMMNFNGSEAVDALNEACNDLHKGADGISKTWSEVDLKIAANFNKHCD